MAGKFVIRGNSLMGGIHIIKDRKFTTLGPITRPKWTDFIIPPVSKWSISKIVITFPNRALESVIL